MAQVVPFETQTPNTLSLTPNTKSEIRPNCRAWGRLYSTYVHLQPVDLENTSFKLGRATECDQCITENEMSSNCFVSISKTHFVITKETDDLIYITDLSKNGTFLNGNRIGKGRTNILQNDDAISIGMKGLKVYVYKSLYDNDNSYLPEELRQKYQISKSLGQGAFGEVKLVFDKMTCKPFAVKKIIKTVTGKPGKGLNHPVKIQSEINILESVKHPCIVALHEIVETKEAVFIVLEYMEGGELSNVILSPTGLSENNAKYLFYQMALGVKYLHDKGITHRDLKPDNVLLKNNSKNNNCQTLVKISDFGLSKIVDENTCLKTICGTPLYVAPEVIDRAISIYDKKVDIWSMGVILFYMLSQELPFRSADKSMQNTLILTGNYSFDGEKWKVISRPAKELIVRMLMVDPRNRITIDEILKDNWIAKDFVMKNHVEDLINSLADTATLESSMESDDCSSPLAKRSKLSSK